DDEQIKKITDSLGLEGFNVNATQSAISMRKYLKERLDQAIYGTKNTDITNFKESQYVGHEVFYDLYETQLGKNVLLEVSSYCLENLREKKGTKLVPIGNQAISIENIVEIEVQSGKNKSNNAEEISKLM